MADPFQFDVFLSHNAKDKPRVRFDEWIVWVRATGRSPRMKNLRLLVLVAAWVAFAAGLIRADPASSSPTNVAQNLPTIFLEAKEPIVSERKVPCSVKMVFPPGSGSASTGALAGVVRIHGATSQMYPKKSFGLTLTTPVPWLGLRESQHWVLMAAAVDRSLMRHKLSYDLFRALSATNAPRYAAASRFIEVNLNGKYQGAYLLMQRVDGSLLQLRRYDSNAPNHATIYKAEDHGADFSQPGHQAYEQREPDPLTGEYWGPLDRFNQFTSSTEDSEFFDPKKGIATRLDLANAIDFHLLVLLTSNLDGYDKNLFIARDAPASGSPPRFFFVPWDYDATFGRNWDGGRVQPTRWLSNYLFERLLSNAEYRKRFAARWKRLREREFSVSAIHQMIDDNVQALGAAAGRNETRWRALTGRYGERLSFDEDVAQMKDWVVARTQWGRILTLPPY
ncbi:MAG TPA: CotH kinase family protein [Verrucomicrobiota bacterium]|nr:CotH kinase family protein [Verrucomicrobiota bacterium]